MEEGSDEHLVMMFFAIAYPIFPRPMKATPLMSQLEEDELILTTADYTHAVTFVSTLHAACQVWHALF